MTAFLLDNSGEPFGDTAWGNRDVLSCAPCIDLTPGTNRDVLAGECKLWWSNAPTALRAVHIMRYGVAFMPGQWLGPQTPDQYREQLLGGFSRLGSEAVWLDELAATFARIGAQPEMVYLSTEDQAQCFEWPDDSTAWAYIDALTGDSRLPRNLRYTTRWGLKPITSLAAWLKTRTTYVKSCWYAFFHPVQWGKMRQCWDQSELGHIPVCSWNQPNYSWTNPATWETESANCIGELVHLPMYDARPEWLAKYRAILEHLDGDVVAHVRPDQPFADQLKLIDEYNVPVALIFCDPTRTTEWMEGIGPMLDQIRTMREE